ncbi:hypothetical protein V1511DRAFT_493869 [Dipodascopsis uninucleata]
MLCILIVLKLDMFEVCLTLLFIFAKYDQLILYISLVAYVHVLQRNTFVHIYIHRVKAVCIRRYATFRYSP